jgi:hypothetical protein
MALQIAPLMVHPEGEVLAVRREVAKAVLGAPLPVDTHGRRFHVEWDPDAPVTPLGQLVFFSQFLATAGLFSDWVKSCPLEFVSNNAPALNDLLGTITPWPFSQDNTATATSRRCALTPSIPRAWA